MKNKFQYTIAVGILILVMIGWTIWVTIRFLFYDLWKSYIYRVKYSLVGSYYGWYFSINNMGTKPELKRYVSQKVREYFDKSEHKKYKDEPKDVISDSIW